MHTQDKKQPIPNVRLRWFRESRNWTQEQTAEKLLLNCGSGLRGEINAKMISKWERGIQAPSFYYRKKLCELYEVQSPAELGFVLSPEELSVSTSANIEYIAHFSNEHPLPVATFPQNDASAFLSRQQGRTQLPFCSQTINQLCTYPDVLRQEQEGNWLALSGDDLVHLLANGWTVDAILQSLQIILKVEQAMSVFSRRHLFQLGAATVLNGIRIPDGRHVSAEDLTKLHQALGDSITEGWSLFLTASNAQVLAIGQAQLSLVQKVDPLLYPSVRSFLYTGVYGLIGIALHFQERDVEALQAHRSGYIAALATGEPWYVSQSLICQSDSYHALGNYDAAIQTIEEALRILAHPTDEAQVRAKAHLLTCWADNAMALENYTMAQEKLKAAEAYLEHIKPNEEFDQTSWLMLKGKYGLLTKDFSSALRSFEESLTALPEQWTLRRAMCTIGQAKAYARLKERDQSLSVAETLIPMVQTVNASMTNRWFTEYLQQDLLDVFPTDKYAREFVTDAYKRLPYTGSAPKNGR